MNIVFQHKSSAKAAFNSFCAKGLVSLLCATLIIALIPNNFAFAEVKKSDLILSTSVQESGISATKCPSIDAEFAILVDANGKTYFERNAYEHTNIASITKVMTAIVALENANLETTITVSQTAAAVGESTAGLRAGDVLTLAEALKGLMVPSGNDAAFAIAESVGQILIDNASASGEALYVADGTQINTSESGAGMRAFVAKMNQTAQSLGCADTLFDNPHGLDYGSYAGNMYSCAHDVSVMVAHAMTYDTFRETVSLAKANISVLRNGTQTELTVDSTDIMIGTYEGACGVKTGYTDLAGPCFAAACSRGDEMLYAVVLNSSSEDQRFTDSEALFDWYYSNQISYSLANSEEFIDVALNGQTINAPVVAEVSLSNWKNKTVKATFANPDQTVDVFALEGNISQSFEFFSVSGAVTIGQRIGTATFYQNNSQVAQVDIISCEDVAAPGIFDSLSLSLSKFTSIFTGEDTQAASEILNDTPLIFDKN